ncbi:MAG: acetyltransferase [Chitinophagaceae bacterium]|nr:acetyltransferase [Chitinophagaceae bacterium]
MIRAAIPADHATIIDVWELSVRATHHFLPEEYLQEIKTLLPGILPQVPVYVYTDDKDAIKGFSGVAEGKIEMLFIHPGSRGQGIGRMLADYCIHTLHADKVDVNEQNEQAVGFYEKIGFHVTGRQELDGQGRPFPLLQMEYRG